jgi:hypothetical protein
MRHCIFILKRKLMKVKNSKGIFILHRCSEGSTDSHFASRCPNIPATECACVLKADHHTRLLVCLSCCQTLLWVYCIICSSIVLCFGCPGYQHIVHEEALCARALLNELEDVLKIVTKIVNVVYGGCRGAKSHPLTTKCCILLREWRGMNLE